MPEAVDHTQESPWPAGVSAAGLEEPLWKRAAGPGEPLWKWAALAEPPWKPTAREARPEPTRESSTMKRPTQSTNAGDATWVFLFQRADRVERPSRAR